MFVKTNNNQANIHTGVVEIGHRNAYTDKIRVNLSYAQSHSMNHKIIIVVFSELLVYTITCNTPYL